MRGCSKAHRIALTLAAFATVGGAPATERRCSNDARVAQAAAAWKARQQQPPLTIPFASATCFRNALLAKLAPQLGPVVGYKVGLWTAAARAAYHVKRPAIGILLRGMIVPERRPIPISFAFSPMAEADFLLVVRDAGINEARTREQVYAHLRGYRPFIELPDNHYLTPPSPDFARLVALDVNARSGVMGTEVKLPPTAAGLAALSQLSAEAVIARPSGTRTETAKARETLGDPVEIALVARDLLRKEGIRLKGGDIISIGTLTPPHAPEAGELFTVHYRVGDHVSGVHARFTH